MKTIRIGNDIVLSWNVRVKGGDPFDLTGQDLSLYRLGFNGRERIETFEVYDNVVKWSWPGAEQKSPGTYSFLLVMNENKEGMRTLEACEALRLVASSCGTCIGMPDHIDLEGILDDYLQAVDKANEAAGEAINAANEAKKVISSMESALNSIKKLLSSGSVYIGTLSSGGEIPKADSNVFMLCGPGKYSVGGSSAEVGIGQLGIVSNASGEWKMDMVQVVDVLQEVDLDSAQTSPNPASVSATMEFLDSYLKLNFLPVNLASIIPGWGRFFSKIDTIRDITDPLDFSETNYLTKEENLKDACVQLDEEVKAANDNIAILGAEAGNLAKTKQDKQDDSLETESKTVTGAINELQTGKQNKLSAGTGIAISDGKVSFSLARNSMTPIRSGEDLDGITVPGIYCSQSNSVSGILNIPKGLDKAFVMFVAETGSVNEYVQLIIGSYANNDMFIRGCYNNANWQAWQQVSTSVNFSKLFGSSMRSVYEACGAVWNEETGYYELNGLTDITEKDILNDWLLSYGIFPNASYRAYRLKRTNFPPMSYMQVYYGVEFSFSLSGSNAEVFNLWPLDINGGVPDVGNRTGFFFPLQLNSSFNSNPRLREILGFIDMSRCTVRNGMSFAYACPELSEIRILNLDNDINFAKQSPLLSYESVKFLVDNAATTAPRTVTIGPVTYSYLTGTAQPAAEVGGTTEEWQALMTAAAGKQISFATEE